MKILNCTICHKKRLMIFMKMVCIFIFLMSISDNCYCEDWISLHKSSKKIITLEYLQELIGTYGNDSNSKFSGDDFLQYGFDDVGNVYILFNRAVVKFDESGNFSQAILLPSETNDYYYGLLVNENGNLFLYPTFSTKRPGYFCVSGTGKWERTKFEGFLPLFYGMFRGGCVYDPEKCTIFSYVKDQLSKCKPDCFDHIRKVAVKGGDVVFQGANARLVIPYWIDDYYFGRIYATSVGEYYFFLYNKDEKPEGVNAESAFELAVFDKMGELKQILASSTTPYFALSSTGIVRCLDFNASGVILRKWAR